jgi:hypothetical protein
MKKTLSLFVLVLGTTLCARAAVPPAEKLLPNDTLIALSIPDFTKWRDIYHNSPPGRFWNDPSMKPFADKFMNKLQSDFFSPLERDLGAHFDDYTNFFRGQLTVAMVQNGWQGKDKDPAQTGLIFLLDTRDKSPLLKSTLADLKKKWVDAGKTVRTEKIRDVDFSVVVLSSNDIPKTLKKKPVTSPDAPEPMEDPDAKNAPKQPIYIGQADSLLIAGNSSKAIEKVLAALNGGSVPVLADQPNFSSAAGMFRDASSCGWINAKAFVDIFIHHSDGADEAPNPFGLDPAKIVSALGVSGLKSIAFAYHYAPDGAQVNVMLGIPESERTGIFKILAGEPKDYNPPPFVPADAAKFQRWRINGKKTWDTLHQIIADASPANAGGVDIMLNSAEMAAKDKDPDFDIHKNLIGNLGDDFITYQKNPKSATFEDIGSAPSIFLIGSPNPEQLGNALKLVASSFFQPPTEREFLGHKIWTFQTAPPRARGQTAPRASSTLSFTGNSGYVAISSEPAMLEEFLRSSGGDAKSLRDTSGLADAAQKVGGPGTSLFGYSNESDNMRIFMEAIKNSPSGTDPFSKLLTLAMISGINTGQVKLTDWIDLSLLPPFSAVSKYFYFSVYAGQATPDGLYFKAFAPVPPGLK